MSRMMAADTFGTVLSLSSDRGQHLIIDQKNPIITIQSIEEPSRILVRLPDLFCPSFGIIRDPALNPHYERMRAESEAWVAQFACFDERMKAIVNRINISYALSIVIPDADAAGLRTMLDWGNWAFPFDEQFDDGVINDPIQAQAMMDILLSAMNSPGAIPTSSEIRPPIVEAHDDLFRRIAVDGPSAITRRYAATMQRYCAGIVSQVSNERGPSRTVSISSKEQFLNRRDTAGIEPLFPLIEHALKLKLPHDVLTHDSIRECERIAIDLVLLANDIVSYRKEESDGFGHNLVAAARRQGLGAQAAFDAVGSMLEERYQDWTVAVAGIPEWGGQIDADVKRYVAAVKNIVVANVNWSFDTTRYFGGMTKTVKETLMVDVLEDVGGTK